MGDVAEGVAEGTRGGGREIASTPTVMPSSTAAPALVIISGSNSTSANLQCFLSLVGEGMLLGCITEYRPENKIHVS